MIAVSEVKRAFDQVEMIFKLKRDEIGIYKHHYWAGVQQALGWVLGEDAPFPHMNPIEAGTDAAQRATIDAAIAGKGIGASLTGAAITNYPFLALAEALPKLRPLEGLIEPIVEFEGCGHILDWYMKGHIDRQQFRDEVQAEWGDDYPAEMVQHIYARWVPAGPQCDGIVLLHFCQRPGHGAFPVTRLQKGGAQCTHT